MNLPAPFLEIEVVRAVVRLGLLGESRERENQTAYGEQHPELHQCLL
jgi:hypothetical protein